MEENRSFDHMFGWYPGTQTKFSSTIHVSLGVNGLNGKEWNSVNSADPKSKRVFVDKNAPMIAPCDPDHGTNATTYKVSSILSNAIYKSVLTFSSDFWRGCSP